LAPLSTGQRDSHEHKDLIMSPNEAKENSIKRLRPKPIIVLEALLLGQTVHIKGMDVAICESEDNRTVLGFKSLSSKDGGPVKEKWLCWPITLADFIKSCEDMSDDDAVITAANTTLTKISQQKAIERERA